MPVRYYEGMGYIRRYQLYKIGYTCDTKYRTGPKIHIEVYSLYRGEYNNETGRVEQGAEIDSGLKVIEAWTTVDESQGHEASIKALMWLNSLLKPYSVSLQPLVEMRHALLRK